MNASLALHNGVATVNDWLVGLEKRKGGNWMCGKSRKYKHFYIFKNVAVAGGRKKMERKLDMDLGQGKLTY